MKPHLNNFAASLCDDYSQDQLAQMAANMWRIIEAADGIRRAQRAYMADRGNQEKGAAVAAAAEQYDQLRAVFSWGSDK